MRIYCIDIETYGKPEGMIRDYLIDHIKPDARLKDPQKVEADVKAKAAAIDEKAALSPTTGRIVCVGIKRVDGLDEETTTHIARTPEEEATMLMGVAEILSHGSGGPDETGRSQPFTPFALVTFNGQSFDLPFLAARTAVAGVKFQWPHPRGRTHCDLFRVLGEHGSLEEWAIALLGRRKKSLGCEIKDLVEREEWEVIRQHCADDVELTAEIYSRLSEACELWR